MKIVGMLNWYDEDPEWLADCVGSAGLLCDSIVAVDGPYALFPGAHAKPRSSAAEVAAIEDAAAAAGMECIVLQGRVWLDGEAEKRNYMLQRARLAGADWLFRIDADELVVDTEPRGVRAQLAAMHEHVAEVAFRHWRGANGGWQESMLRVMFRNLPMMWIAGHHGRVQGLLPDGEHVVLFEPIPERLPHVTAGRLWGVNMEHRSQDRPPGRRAKKDAYYELARHTET